MTNREKAANYTRQLGLLKIVERNFKKGRLMQSCGGMGVLFFADERQQAKAKELEEQYAEDNAVVWHIIADTVYYGERRSETVAYLIANDASPESLTELEDGFVVFVYVENISVPEFSEYGEALVTERAGGLARRM